MSDVVDFPVKRTYPRTMTASEMWDSPDPSDQMVWEVCLYLRNCNPCHNCPRYETDEHYGTIMQGCYVMAAEACRVVMAMQRRESVIPAADKK